MQAQSQYPIKVTWRNDSEALTKVVTRELETRGHNPDGNTFTPDEIETISMALVARQQSNVVIESANEARLVVKLLNEHVTGIGHPRWGATWATTTLANAVQRRIDMIEDAADL
jgi:hypothetical protein